MKMSFSFRINLVPVLKYGSVIVTVTAGLTYAYYLGRKRAERSYRPARHVSQNEEIESLLGRFTLDDETLRLVMQLLEEEMEKGLNPETADSSDLKMIPSHVRHLPDGNERGRILALDLGGTNFRVLDVNLQKDKHVDIYSKIFVIPERLLSGQGECLFDHMARSLSEFMKQRHMCRRSRTHYPLGFTFSFPCKQNSLNSATLIEWTKGFSCPGVIGTDVVEQLQKAITKRGDLNVKVAALVNDTVGTLMTCAHRYSDCYIGAIFGTGTNACYLEDIDRVLTWSGDKEGPQHVVINTEWGAFGDNECLEFLRTPYDAEVDKGSVNPGKQRFEKMISGLYVGELTRVIILDLLERQLIFPGLLTQSQGRLGYIRQIFTPGGFYSRNVSDIEQDEGVAFNETKKKLEDLGFENPSYEDCAIVRNVCERVSARAANLAAAAIAVLINRVGKSNVTVGIDGSMYRHHPRFKRNMQMALSRLVDRRINYRLVLSEDGSGKGAALVAAVADHLNRSYSNEYMDEFQLEDMFHREKKPLGKNSKVASSPALMTNGLM